MNINTVKFSFEAKIDAIAAVVNVVVTDPTTQTKPIDPTGTRFGSDQNASGLGLF